MRYKVDIVANSFLFLSSLLLLIDIAPSDFSPLYSKRVKAIQVLKENQNIVRHVPHTNIVSQTQKILIDDNSFEILKDLIITNSSRADEINWDAALGIKYDIISVPNSLFDIRTLYVVITSPTGNITSLIPVGELRDLDKWLQSRHQGSLTLSALILLMLGFLLQLSSSIINNKKEQDKQETKNVLCNLDYQYANENSSRNDKTENNG